MPDSTKNFAIDTSNAPVGATQVTRAQFIDILEHLNYVSGNIRSIDELATGGLLSIDGTGNANARTLEASTGLTWSNATGSAGNPSISISDPEAAWNALHSVESNTITNTKLVSVIASAGSYALPTPPTSQVACKVVINSSSGDVVITSGALADKDALGNATSSVTIPTKNMAIFYSDNSGSWFLQNSSRLLIQ